MPSVQLAMYPKAILDAVERAVDVGSYDEYFDCDQWKTTYLQPYAKCHALCHLASPRSSASDAISIPNIPARQALLQLLTETLDELQLRHTDPDELHISPDVKKRQRDPQWEICESNGKIYDAITRCRREMASCDISDDLEVRLAMATYCKNVDGGEYHVVDMLFALDMERPLWDEVRLHLERPFFSGAYSNSATPTWSDRFQQVEQANWRRTRPKKMRHFCDLLKRPEDYSHSEKRFNVTVNADNVVFNHIPTERTLLRTQLERSISLSAILDANESELDNMTKLVLAVTLSYSLFYLYGGPWLGNGTVPSWDSNKIMFFETNGRIQLRPFLRTGFRATALSVSDQDMGDANNNNDDNDGNDDEDMYHPYPALVSFAMTLLEIHLGKTLEQMDQSQGVRAQLTNANDRWAFASKVFQQRKYYFPGPNYRDAIAACLHPDFGDFNIETDSEDEGDESDSDDDVGTDSRRDDSWARAHETKLRQLRRVIFHKVVCPLHDELELAFGKDIVAGDIDKHAAKMTLISGHPVVTNCVQPARHMGATHDEFPPPTNTSQHATEHPSSQRPRMPVVAHGFHRPLIVPGSFEPMGMGMGTGGI